ncbi:MAG TPA: YCF48-related protein [Thermoanaerobaculia bacterium]|nr:YCF48-related protein [Thermoanaerobaculia bacterium]
MTRKALVGFALWVLLASVSRLGAAEWHPAPIYGADVRSLAIVPDDPDTLLAGTSAGQVYLSQNGGRSWKDAGAPLPFPGWVVSRLVFDPNKPSRLWVALWGVWGSGQVAYSDDLGKSWSARSAGLPDEPVYTLALVPGKEGRLYAGTLSGVYGSEDGGASWKHLTGDLPEMAKVTSLFVDPTLTDTVIAGTWRQAYRSEDGGRTWAGVFQGMVLDTEVFSLTAIPDHPGEIWASTCGWVYQTVDRGNTWTRFKTGLDERRTPSFAPLPDGRLLAGTVSGLYASTSTDVAHTWVRIGDPALSVMAIAVDRARPDRIVLGTEGSGIWLSNDGGKFFQRTSRGMTNTRIAALAAVGDELLVAVNHAGPISGIHVSRDRGKTFDGLFAPLPTVVDVAVHKGRPYAATERGLYQRLGQDWHRIPELGDGRIEQILSNGTALVARTAARLYELRGDKFVEKAYKHDAPRSAALLPGALWVTDDKGLYRLTANANHTILTPAGGGGRLERLADRLLFWGPAGAWTRRDDPEALWVELPARPNRVVPTGDARYPVLLITGDKAALFDRETRTEKPVDLPVLARDVTAALILDGKLLVGTSGYGVLVGEMTHQSSPP